MEEELRKRMIQRAKLDEHLKQLRMLKEGMAAARKQVGKRSQDELHVVKLHSFFGAVHRQDDVQ